MTVAVYPGTFDPLTRGHEDLVRRASSIFDQLIVGVASSRSKHPFFTLEERIDIAKEVLGHYPNVKVVGFDGLLKDFKSCSAKSCHFNFKLKAEHASQLKLVALPKLGVILVPKDWQDVQASAGANGTGSALLMGPNPKQAIELYDSSVCVGCGMPYATLYFPNLPKQSLEYEYGYRYGYPRYYGSKYRSYGSKSDVLNKYEPNKEVLNRFEIEERFEHIRGRKFKEELLKELRDKDL